MEKEKITFIGDCFELKKIHSNLINPKPLLDMTVCVGIESTHPIAVFLRNIYGKKIDASRVANLKEYSGFGVCAEVDGYPVCVGNEEFMKRFNFIFDDTAESGFKLHIAWNRQYAGYIVVAKGSDFVLSSEQDKTNNS